MSKIIVLGDTHGRTIWKDIINQNPDADKFIFIGDYLDTHERITGEQQGNNLLDIIQFKKDNPEKVVLLIGNHDYHYMSFLNVSEHYSGFQSGMQYQFNHILKENIQLFQMAYLASEGYLCTHAGVSDTFLESIGYKGEEPIDMFINDVFHYQPLKFKFNGRDSYGDDKTQSPIWIRPQSLFEDRVGGYNQVVGHTIQKSIVNPKYIEDHLWFIDALGTSKEYVIIEDNKISVHKAV